MNVRKFMADIDSISPDLQEELNKLADSLDDANNDSAKLNEIWQKIKATMASVVDDEIAKAADTLGASKEEVEEYT
jgi:ABC-type transporter Mla subunit MlaD